MADGYNKTQFCFEQSTGFANISQPTVAKVLPLQSAYSTVISVIMPPPWMKKGA